jgi:hypothetical protein
VPDPLSILRLAALVAFIGLIAMGLWLLDVAWWVVPPVMAVALVIAWTIEWLAWRGATGATVIRETAAEQALPVAPVEEPVRAPAAAIVPPEPTPPPEPQPEPQPEPGPQPPPRAEPAPRPKPPTQQEPQPPQPEPQPPPQPEPEPEPEPAPEPPAPPEPVAAPPGEQPQPRQWRPRRIRLLPSQAPRPQPPVEPEPAPPAAKAGPVVQFRPRVEPRSWNLWDLERIARDETRDHPERRDELAYLFLHLRQFADADGTLPREFDGLVRESFGGRLERPHGA